MIEIPDKCPKCKEGFLWFEGNTSHVADKIIVDYLVCNKCTYTIEATFKLVKLEEIND